MLCLSLDLRGFCAFLFAFGAMASSGAGRRPLSRRGEIWLGGSCPWRRALAGQREPGGCSFKRRCHERWQRNDSASAGASRFHPRFASRQTERRSRSARLQDAPSSRFRSPRHSRRLRRSQITTRGSIRRRWSRLSRKKAQNEGQSPMIVVRVGAGNEQPGRSSGEIRLLLDTLGCVFAGVPINPRPRLGCELELKSTAFLATFIDLKPLINCKAPPQ